MERCVIGLQVSLIWSCVLFMEPCQSGLTYLFAKEAGASKPLGSSNLPGSARDKNLL